MNVSGLVAEYNPFHNGHLHHLQQSMSISGAEYAISVMSGNFIQRGEPAVVSKWARTAAALKSGVDLVIELPVVYAMASAEYFSFGAVKILDRLGVVSSLCFGSESGNLDGLYRLASLLSNEPENYQAALKGQLSLGHSFPAARENAIKEYLSSRPDAEKDDYKLLGSPNNILGIEYLKALTKLGSTIKPCTIPRISNDYHTSEITGSVSSATAIRSRIHTDPQAWDNEVESSVPASTLEIMKDEFINGRGPVSTKDYENMLLAGFRQMDLKQIAALPYVEEGLEGRILKAAQNAGSLEEFIEQISTKRYPRTRIQRILLHKLTGLTKEEFELFNRNGGPQYIKVLGFNSKGRTLLSEIKKKAALPVITKAADHINSPDPLIRRMLEIEAYATDMYVLGYKNPLYRKAGQEFTQNIIREQP